MKLHPPHPLTGRSLIPGLFILAVFLGRTLYHQSLSGLKRFLLIALILIGSVTALVEFRRHIIGIYNSGEVLQTPTITQVTGIGEWGLTTKKEVTIIVQYLGSVQAPFFKWLAARHFYESIQGLELRGATHDRLVGYRVSLKRERTL